MTTSELATWQSEYRGHPGEALLPHNMSPTTLSDFQANHIALLLPLTGTHAASAQAIREGFMASLAFEHNQGGVAPRITLIDTQDDHNIAQAYREAQEAGAQMIIGPLTKPGVEQISRLASRDLPILALNNIDQLTPSYLFQFGLAPEDEARQAADRAFQDGHLNALIIAQSGEWGERLTQAFTQRWESLGGTVVGITEYDLDQPLAGAVKSALKIDTSEARAQSLINTLNIPLEFDPRRRQDIDMVFIASQPVQARQIPPLLAFYFAHDLPIYATSSVYSSNSTSAENKDLNGLVFCDIPWNIIARPVTPESDNLIAALWPEPTQAQPRLYALGVDAYQLVQVLPRLQAIPHFSLNGATGKLSLDNNHRIVRNLRCTKFTNGEPKRLDPHA